MGTGDLDVSGFAGVCDVSIPGGEEDFTDEKTGKANVNVGSLRDSCLFLDTRLRDCCQTRSNALY